MTGTSAEARTASAEIAKARWLLDQERAGAASSGNTTVLHALAAEDQRLRALEAKVPQLNDGLSMRWTAKRRTLPALAAVPARVIGVAKDLRVAGLGAAVAVSIWTGLESRHRLLQKESLAYYDMGMREVEASGRSLEDLHRVWPEAQKLEARTLGPTRSRAVAAAAAGTGAAALGATLVVLAPRLGGRVSPAGIVAGGGVLVAAGAVGTGYGTGTLLASRRLHNYLEWPDSDIYPTGQPVYG